MNQESKSPTPLTSSQRREFLKKAKTFAVAAPATALLLHVSSKPAQAVGYAPPPTTTTILVPSDRRLKRDIVREGTLPNGLGVYSYRYHWNAQRFVGVMADEVEAVMPGAVMTHSSGYKMVDYSKVLA